jgi:hypothetical protein
MAAMVKKMVYLDAEQDQHVKQLARAAKTSETEVIRRAVEAYWEREAAQIKVDTQRIADYVRAHPEGWPDEPSEWFHG